MFKVKGYKRIIGIVTILIVANFLFANFVYAAPPATSADGIILNQTKFVTAQATQAACLAFKTEVLKVTKNEFKAVWNTKPIDVFNTTIKLGGNADIPKNCFIAQFSFSDSGDQKTVNREAQSFQNQIIQNTVSEKTVNQRIIGADTEEKEAAWWSKAIGYIFTGISTIISSILGIFVGIAWGIMFSAVNATIGFGDKQPTIVLMGWTIVRDVMNMIFILAMIVMSLATILRIEKYNYKTILVKLILMALLINFSLVISTTIISVFDVLIKIFMPTAGLKDITALMLSIVKGGFHAAQGGAITGILSAITEIIFMLIMLIVFLSLTGLFVVRMVGLYVLVILSPVAYALNILPDTQEYAKKWWTTFFKYLIWGPVAMFFIRLTVVLTENGGLNGIGTTNSDFTFVILAGFMAAAVLVSKQAGMMGSEAIVGTAEKAMGAIAGSPFAAAKFGAKRGIGFAGRYYNEWTSKLLEAHEGKKAPGIGRKTLFAVLNPKAFVKGWGVRSEELAKMHRELAEAGGREVSEQFLTTPFWTLSSFRHPFRNIKRSFKEGGALRIPYRQFIERHEENEFLKTYTEMKKEALMAAAVEAEKLGGNEGEVRKRSIVKAAAANGYLDDLMRMKQFAVKYTGSDNVVYSAESLNRFLFGYLGHGEQAMRFMAEDMEELGKKVKHYEYLGHAKYDPSTREFTRGIQVKTKKDPTKSNQFERNGKVYEKVKRGKEEFEVEVLDFNKDSWQQSYAVGEFAKLGGRERVSAAPHNFTVIRAEIKDDGSFTAEGDELGAKDGELHFGREHGDFDVFNQEMLKRMDSDTMREVQHTQARLKSWLVSDKLVVDSHGTIVLEDDEHRKELEKVYQINPEFVKGLYTKILKVKGDQREVIDGIRFVLKENVNIDAATGTATFKPGKSFENAGGVVGTPTFKYSDNPPKVLDSKGKDIPKTQAQIDAENEPT